MKKNSTTSLWDCIFFEFPAHHRDSAKLVALSFPNEIPFRTKRLFFIESINQEERGNHAHKVCNQFFVRTAGNVSLTCRDGISEKTFNLSEINQGLFVPSGIWVNLKMGPFSSVAVLTDKQYDERDYISEWQSFLQYKEIN